MNKVDQFSIDYIANNSVTFKNKKMEKKTIIDFAKSVTVLDINQTKGIKGGNEIIIIDEILD